MSPLPKLFVVLLGRGGGVSRREAGRQTTTASILILIFSNSFQAASVPAI